MNEEEIVSEILRKIVQDIDRILHENEDGCGVGCAVNPSTNLIYLLECERIYHIHVWEGDVVVSDYNPARPVRQSWLPVARISLADPNCFEKVVDKAFEIKRLKHA